MTRIRFSLTAFTLILIAGFASAGKPAAGTEKYPFAIEPSQAFAKLAGFDKASKPTLVATKDLSFAEVCLVASGVADAEKRKTYLAKIDGIETAAQSHRWGEDFEGEGRTAAQVSPCWADSQWLRVRADPPAHDL